MGFHSWCEYENVIDIDDDTSCAKDRVEQHVHDSLKSCRRVAQAEEHDLGNVGPKGGNEGCSVAVFRANANVVESPSDVKLGENHG